MSIELLAPIGLDELVEQAALLERIDRKYVVPRAVAPRPDRRGAGRDAGARARGSAHARLSLGLPRHPRPRQLPGGRPAPAPALEGAQPRLPRHRWLVARGEDPLRARPHHQGADPARRSRVGGRSTSAGVVVRRCLAGRSAGRRRAGQRAEAGARDVVRPQHPAPARHPADAGHHRHRARLDVAGASRSARDLDRPGLAIVETKGGSTPSAMDRLLWARGHRPVSISKYGVGVAALHDVPRLKWHRVLARDLGVRVVTTMLPTLRPESTISWARTMSARSTTLLVDHGEAPVGDQVEQRGEAPRPAQVSVPPFTLPRARSASLRSPTTSSMTPSSASSRRPASMPMLPTASKTRSNCSDSVADRRHARSR